MSTLIKSNNRKGHLRTLQQNMLVTPPEERFGRITRLTKRLFDVPIAIVTLADERRLWLKPRQGLDVVQIARKMSFCNHVTETNSVLVVENTLCDDEFKDHPFVVDEPYVRFYAGCPIVTTDKQHVGTLCIVNTKPRTFSDRDKDLLQELAKLVDNELQLLSLSLTDELTQISNRRGFMKIANYIYSLCQRLEQPVTLFFIDINDFKGINDQYGHETGDHVLMNLAQTLLDTFRESDIIARFGGDEFVVLCSNLDETSRGQLLERLADNVATYNHSADVTRQFFYSIGFATQHPQAGDTLTAFLHQADMQMYSNK